MQQVRAEVRSKSISPFDYLFERESAAWDPRFAHEGEDLHLANGKRSDASLLDARGGMSNSQSWKLVIGLEPRLGAPREKDETALKLASPASGSFVLVSLRRRSRDQKGSS
jgi:hypothetical protein